MHAKDEFLRSLRLALRYLYDPSELSKNPIWGYLAVTGGQSSSQLREILIDAIHALRPTPDMAQQSQAWRIYRTLTHRFIEQFSQAEVAINLGISIRQMRRQEKQALEALTDFLWNTYNLEGEFTSQENPSGGNGENRPDELTWLEKSLPHQTISLGELVEPVLITLRSLMNRTEVKIDIDWPQEHIELDVQKAPTQQVLVKLLTHAILTAPGGTIRIDTSESKNLLSNNIQSIPKDEQPLTKPKIATETLDLLHKLVSFSHGILSYTEAKAGKNFKATLAFLIQKKMPILFIDDNQDALDLFKRFLETTHYTALTARMAEEGISLAQSTQPRAILLDVMMPEVDGWELLGRLREHPQTRNIPVILCSILPNEQLAHELGAVAFLQKPIKRKAFLQLLDRITAVLDPEYE